MAAGRLDEGAECVSVVGLWVAGEELWIAGEGLWIAGGTSGETLWVARSGGVEGTAGGCAE